MTILYLVSCCGFIIGAFALLSISPQQFTDDIFDHLLKGRKKNSVKEEIIEATGKRKMNFIQREIIEAQTTLRLSNRSHMFPMICAVSLSLFIAGLLFALTLGNMLLVPVLSVGFMLLPFWYLKLASHNYIKDINAQLETSLSIITTAYLRNEDILTAVEENLRYLTPPIKQVMEEFDTRIRMIDPDIIKAIHDMKSKINNDVFHEWCDALVSCQYDHTLKSTLTPIVNKLSDMRMVNAELEYLIFEPRKEFITMALLVICNIPLLYFLNRDWYEVLMHTLLGQLLLMITGILIFFSMARVIRITKPIEYKR